MNGILHAYYNVVLAPPIGALLGMGVTVLWRRRNAAALLVLAAVMAASAGWSAVLLERTPDFVSWLAPLLLGVGGGSSLALAALAMTLAVHERRARLTPSWSTRRPALTARTARATRPGIEAALRPAVAAVLALGLAAGLAAPTAYSLATAATSHDGAIPEVGPADPAGAQGPVFGAGGGLVDATRPTPTMVEVLLIDANRYDWVAATVGSNNAAGYQLATGRPVMPIGGFNGSDPFPTLVQFQQLVAQRRIHWFVDSYRFQNIGGSNDAHDIATWVQSNYHPQRVDGVLFYDLNAPAAYRE
jgi:hypothetical protein